MTSSHKPGPPKLAAPADLHDISHTAPEFVVRILLEVTTALSSLLDLDEVLGETLDRIMALTDATAGTLILVDRQGCATRKISMRHGVPYKVSGEVLKKVMTSGLAGWVCRHSCVARVGDTIADDRWLHLPHDLYKHRSALVVPVVRHGVVLGVFTLTHVAPEHFDEDLEQLMMAIAGQAAIAVENARLFGEVQRLATTDGLTGLFNRRHFFELAEAEVDGGALPLSAILADIDHFKAVNDTWGHAAGDEVLSAIAARLLQVVGDRGIVGRYGGEEFVVLLPGMGQAGARDLAEQLRRAVEREAVPTASGPLQLAISLGVAEVHADTVDLGVLLGEADARLYQAKEAGRNRVM